MKPEKKFQNKKEETSISSLSLLIKSPIQVLTGTNWLDIESPFMSTFLPLDHSSTKIRHNRHSKTIRRIDKTYLVQSFQRFQRILHKEVTILLKEEDSFTRISESFTRRWYPSQGGAILHKEVAILHKEVQSFTRRWESFIRRCNPSQGGGNPSQGGGILHKELAMLHKEVAILYQEEAILHKEVEILRTKGLNISNETRKQISKQKRGNVNAFTKSPDYVTHPGTNRDQLA